jgi:DegV family protein with EDD domain
MKKPIGIVTDSHSSITQAEAAKLGIKVLPMPFYIDEVCYYEDITLSREAFFEKLRSGVKVTSSQPSPEAVMEIWDEALKEYEEILYLPISSGLSGSCQTAQMLAQEDAYEGKVHVVDNGRVSTPLHRSILDALELIDEGYSAAQVKEILEKYRDKMVIYVAIDDLQYLQRGGRINAASAMVASVLNIKPVVKFDIGKLDVYHKCRGMMKARHTVIEALKHDRDTIFKEWADRGELYLMTATSTSPEETKAWIQEIEEAFPGIPVMSDDLSLGVSCHIGPGGLGAAWSCRPIRPNEEKNA